MFKIIHLKHSEIDTDKWNNCITNSVNNIVYAFSWYLDIVCENWEALIANNYEAVMPLPVKRKLGIEFIYQPLFTQQLGIFSTIKLNPELVDKFLQAIPEKYKLIWQNLNTYNKAQNPGFSNTSQITYALDLIYPYKFHYSRFSTNTKRNINKAQNTKISVSFGLTPKALVNLIRQNVGLKLKFLKESDYNRIYNIIMFALRNKFGLLYGAYTPENELCAAAFFIQSDNKAIFLFSASNKQGIKNKAMFLLVDEFIKKNCESNLTLDFEGSKIEGLARFYSGFGAKPYYFQQIKRNNLPWYLKMFVRI
ncbi:MAG: hypothetical protein HY738_10200 [Bacteroidia bacterium]|nr:hypothetical protein [Bacteroidia bacterium]